MWRSFKSVSGMTTATFNQGTVGHQALRPTTIATNYPEVMELNGDFDFESHCVPTSLLDRPALRRWSPYLESLIAKAAVNYTSLPMAVEHEAVEQTD